MEISFALWLIITIQEVFVDLHLLPLIGLLAGALRFEINLNHLIPNACQKAEFLSVQYFVEGYKISSAA